MCVLNCSENIPTMLVCGHNCCLSHVTNREITKCIICLAKITKFEDAKPSFDLIKILKVYSKFDYNLMNVINLH